MGRAPGVYSAFDARRNGQFRSSARRPKPRYTGMAGSLVCGSVVCAVKSAKCAHADQNARRSAIAVANLPCDLSSRYPLNVFGVAHLKSRYSDIEWFKTYRCYLGVEDHLQVP